MSFRIAFLPLFFLHLFGYSQDYIYKEFGLNEGLPSSQVYDIYQDKNGIIWFATDRGIANYNGYEIKTFGIKDGVLNNVVLNLYPQKNGVVYCSTFNNQLFYFNENFTGFKPYKYNNLLSKYLKNNQTILNLYIDDNNTINIGCESMNGKLSISNNGKVTTKTVKNTYLSIEKTYTVFEKKPNNAIFYYLSNNSSQVKNKDFNFIKNENNVKNQVILLKNDNYLIHKSLNSISIFNKNGDKVKEIKTNYNPLYIKALNETHFFIGYLYGGGKIVDVKGNIIESFLENESISNFLIDHEGGYWLTTLHSGVYYIKEPKIKVYSQSPLRKPINSLTKNNKNEIFVGYNDGKVLKIDSKGNSSIIYNSKEKLRAFVEFDAKTNNIYLQSHNHLIINENFTNKQKYIAYVLKVSEPNEKGLIFSHINRITLVSGKDNDTYKLIAFPFRVHDACYWNDDIYLGTFEGSYIYSNEKLHDLSKINSLFKNRVDDVDYNEERNELYFATIGNGLIVYNKNNENVYSISKKEGLLSDIVNEIHIENKNEIWVCTNSGLNKIFFDKNGHYKITGLKSSNGLLNDGINDVEILNDTVWIASKKGLVYAPKSLFENVKEDKNNYLKINRVYVNDSLSSIKSLKNLSYYENRIELFFEGISFKNNNELTYKYTLEGLDKKWYYTKNRKITFPSLPNGNYIFKVAVLTSLKDKNIKYLKIPISIKAPFWKTSWFIILSIFSLITLIYLFFKTRVLVYNQDIIRELLRLLMKKIKRKEKYYAFKEAGKEIRIKTDTILYVKSSGNYIDLKTENKTYTIRCKIGDFISSTPDPLEYLRIHRSYIIRIDKVESKSKTEIVIKDEKLPVSNSYEIEIEKLFF